MNPAQAPWLHDLTLAAFALHVGAGFIALFSGFVAAFAAKGGKLHRGAGLVFLASMLVMALFAAYLGAVIPDQLINVFVAAFTAYLVVTSWLSIHRRDGASGWNDKLALLVSVILLAPFALLSFELAFGLPTFITSAIPFKGAPLVAVYVFTTALAIAAFGDARVAFAGGVKGAPRISRHIWRMCLGLTLATGSAFTNGFSRLLPGPHHVPAVFFLPQFIPLLLLVFWMIRVRFKGWRDAPAARPA